MEFPEILSVSRRRFLGLASAACASLKSPGFLWASDLEATSDSVPQDLPLPQSRPSTEKWIRRAIVLQPWGATEYKALTQLPELPGQLKKEFGFNALIVLPTEAHNALTDAALPLTDPATRLTDSQFRSGLNAYRKENYKVILYSSVMHCGHAPVWQSGELGRKHPDWLQRDAYGQTIGAFGQAWLCPSSPARSYTLNYTLKLVRDYSPDAIMLDNNGFGHTAKGFSCYCEYCERAFREYVLARCGTAWVRDVLRIDPGSLRIPKDPGPLLVLWLCWRSRVWAETNELFRSSLRQLNREIVFFVNIQYDQDPDPQGSRLQFSREDLIFSETHESDSWYISQKLVLGQALTQGNRPLWNYLANFQDRNPLRLRSPQEVSLMIAATLAHGALPWINYPGLDSVQDQESRKEIARYVSWFALHPELFEAKQSTPIGAVVSLLTRDAFESINDCSRQGVTGCSASAGTPPLIPSHIGSLLRMGMPVAALRESEITKEKLRDFRIVTLATARIVGASQSEALANWVRAGGTLIAVSDAGEYDELGRKRSHSTVWQALSLPELAKDDRHVGQGTVQVHSPDQFDGAVFAFVQSAKLAFSAPQGIEVVCCESPRQYFLHLVRHEKTNALPSLGVPGWLMAPPGKAEWHSPDWEEPRSLTFQPGASLNISDPPMYSVIVLNR